MAQPSRRNGNDADVIRHVSKARQSGQPKKESPGHSVEPGILGHGRPWGPGVPAGQEGNVAAPSTVPDSAGGSGAVAGGSDGAGFIQGRVPRLSPGNDPCRHRAASDPHGVGVQRQMRNN